MEFAFRRRKEYVHTLLDCPGIISISLQTVTDMLVAVLNTCTKEELEEEEEETLISPTSQEESGERRKVIKNKILAVGRMARVFALLRFVFISSLRLQRLTQTVVRNRRRSPNSRMFLGRPNCLSVRWLWAPRVLRMQSLALTTRKFAFYPSFGNS